MTLRETFGLGAGTGILIDVLLTGGDILLMLGDALFIPFSVTASWVAPNLPWLDTGLVTALAAIFAVLYVISRLEDQYQIHVNDNDN